MLTQYGHVKIRWQDKDYVLSPNLINMSKLGTPKEIIEDFKQFIEASVIWKFIIASRIVDACSDTEIPEGLIGAVKYSKNKNRFMYVQPKHGLPMINDVIVLAEHLYIHGICGKLESNKSKGEKIEEFDPYKIMEMARVHLEVSAEEASKMTMTEFLRMVRVKFPPEESDRPSEELDAQLQQWFAEQNEVH